MERSHPAWATVSRPGSSLSLRGLFAPHREITVEILPVAIALGTAQPPGLPGLIPIQYPGPGPPCATPTHNGITSLLAVSNTQAPVCLLTFSQRLPPT